MSFCAGWLQDSIVAITGLTQLHALGTGCNLSKNFQEEFSSCQAMFLGASEYRYFSGLCSGAAKGWRQRENHLLLWVKSSHQRQHVKRRAETLRGLVQVLQRVDDPMAIRFI